MAQQKGWDATGRLEALWLQLPGKRDELAELSNVRGNELSSHNNGKPLGRMVAQRIIDGFAKKEIIVSRLELGAPLEEADEPAQTLLDLLQELRTATTGLEETVDRIDKRVARLERRRGAGGSQPAHTGP